MSEIYDLIIVGGGPVGLYANQYALKKGMKTRLVEQLPQLGGQLKSLYPEMPLHNVAGLESWTASKFIDNLIAQTEKYQPDYRLGEQVREIKFRDMKFTLVTDKAKHPCRSVLITTGRGVYMSPSLANMNEEQKKEAGLLCDIEDEECVLGKRVVVIGGSQETVGWALQAAAFASSVIIINWRFMESYGVLEGNMAIPPNMDIIEPYGLLELIGEKKLESVKIFHVSTGEEKVIPADAIIMARGYLANLYDLKAFGVELDHNGIKVTSDMHTSRPGVFAAGDAVYYQGKKRLISTGSAEAAKAVDSAEQYLKSVWGGIGGKSS